MSISKLLIAVLFRHITEKSIISLWDTNIDSYKASFFCKTLNFYTNWCILWKSYKLRKFLILVQSLPLTSLVRFYLFFLSLSSSSKLSNILAVIDMSFWRQSILRGKIKYYFRFWQKKNFYKHCVVFPYFIFVSFMLNFIN